MTIEQRLIAKLHLRQVEALIRLAGIEKGVDSMLSSVNRDLLKIVTSGDYSILKSLAFEKVFVEALGSVKVSFAKSFKEMASWGHRTAADAYFDSIPKKVIAALVPIEPSFESVRPPRPGKLVFEYGSIRLVYEDQSTDPFGVPTQQLKQVELTDEEKLEVAKQIIFPPPSQKEVTEILAGGSHRGSLGNVQFQTWEQRFDGLSRIINDKKMAFNEIVSGFANGENITQIRKRLEPLVDGVKSSAQRIARTEGMRIANRMQQRAWDGLGDMMVGSQIIAVLDENTRPEHATRSGTIYYKQPRAGQKSLSELPDLPDEPNCRCMAVPVLEPPEELKNDPEIREAFKQSKGKRSGEPETYDKWFKSVDPGRRKIVTGVARYKEVESQLAGQREPQWTDFIDDDGSLLSLEQIANETAVERTARKQRIGKAIATRRKALREISDRGFEFPRS